jgi:hypothetical protein
LGRVTKIQFRKHVANVSFAVLSLMLSDFSSAEDVPADQRTCEFEECCMNVRAAFEANAKTTETMEPRVSPFNDPTAFAEAATVFGAAPCDFRSDAALAKSATMGIGIVATVA